LKLICNRNLRFPRGVAFSPGGELWISDTENRRVVSADGSARFDFTNHPGFPVGLTSHQDRLCVAFPYERLLTSATEAATGQWHGADFYPYAIARFEGDLWTSHPASGIVRSQREGVTHAGLADPIAMVSWRGHLAGAERDRACITCFRRADATRKILLPEGSQPRALAVSPDGVLWIATQTPKMLFACHDGWRAEPVCPLAVAGAPRAMAWTAEGIALAASSVNGILWIIQNDGRAINEFPLPEPPVSLAADGGAVFAGLERRRVVIGLTRATVTEIAGEVITPRGLLPEGGQLHIVESLAHRVRRADVARAVHVV
jgi:sugar lactone lactonase YvrE